MNSIYDASTLMANLNGNTVLFQAIGAMMRGENPKQFLSKLAQNNPQMKKLNLDFDNLEQSAQQVCNDKGIDMNSKIQEIKSSFFNK